jgi:uncharacterized protein (DUF2132 family)
MKKYFLKKYINIAHTIIQKSIQFLRKTEKNRKKTLNTFLRLKMRFLGPKMVVTAYENLYNNMPLTM